jgi:hypothetical protein
MSKKHPTAVERTLMIPGVDVRPVDTPPVDVYCGPTVTRVAQAYNAYNLVRCDHYALEASTKSLCGVPLDRKERGYLTQNVCQACRSIASMNRMVVK